MKKKAIIAMLLCLATVLSITCFAAEEIPGENQEAKLNTTQQEDEEDFILYPDKTTNNPLPEPLYLPYEELNIVSGTGVDEEEEFTATEDEDFILYPDTETNNPLPEPIPMPYEDLNIVPDPSTYNVFDGSWEAVSGTDLWPYRQVCFLSVHYKGQDEEETHQGSGFVMADKTVVTAGHNLFHPTYGEADRITVIPGYDGSWMPYGSFKAVAWGVPDDFVACTDTDYGYITTDGKIASKVGKFGWRAISDPEDMNAELTGYPDPKEYNGKMWTDYDQILELRRGEIRYELDALGGDSGAPVYDDDAYLIGIHTTGSPSGNRGAFLTADTVRWLKKHF